MQQQQKLLYRTSAEYWLSVSECLGLVREFHGAVGTGSVCSVVQCLVQLQYFNFCLILRMYRVFQGGLEPIGPMALPRNTRAVVGRAPVMAPADLRLLTAADPRVLSTELRKMTNVIVFPRCGAESEPSKMGGGDLDGDCFFIIWDSALVPADEAPALNYSVSGAQFLVPIRVWRLVLFSPTCVHDTHFFTSILQT